MNKARMEKKVLIFDVWGNYAHFRRFYTTTSPLTFPFPPRTTLCGLVGAIIGLEKENNEYLKHFTLDKASIGLRLLNPVKKMMIAENLIHTKNAKGPGMNLIKERTQIGFEFLKDPKFRIYFHHADENIYEQLKENLLNHKSTYTPCLGLSENIANFMFVGEFKVRSVENDGEYVKINSILPIEAFSKQGVKFKHEGEYFSIRVPIEMNTERIVTKYGNFLFERNGKPIEVKLTIPYLRTESEMSENFVFIE